MQTRCQGVNIDDYSFGLVCVDKAGVPVRHLFGKGSFDPEETFDTLIACDQCLGLEDIPDAIAMNGQVLALSEEIRSLKRMMVNISRNLAGLQQVVFSRGRYVMPATVGGAVPAVAVVPAGHAAVAHSTEVHHHYHHYHNVRKVEETEPEPAPEEEVPEIKEPENEPEPASEEPQKNCVQFNGMYVDSYESTPVVISQTGCDVTAKWGPALTVFGKIEGDVLKLNYEGWGNPEGQITDGLVTWRTANFWTWTKESAAQDAINEAEQTEAVPAKPCNLRSLAKKLNHIENKLADMSQESNSLLSQGGKRTSMRRKAKAAAATVASFDTDSAADASVIADDVALPQAPAVPAEDAASSAAPQDQPAAGVALAEDVASAADVDAGTDTAADGSDDSAAPAQPAARQAPPSAPAAEDAQAAEEDSTAAAAADAAATVASAQADADADTSTD
jgi:hypothetical protein